MRFGGLCKKSKHLTRTQNAKIIMRVDFCHLHAHAHSHRAFARRPTWDMPVNIQHTISPIETVFVNAISLVSLSDARTLFVRAISCAIHALIAYHSAFSLNFKCSRAVHDTHVRHMATQNRHHLTDDMNCVFFFCSHFHSQNTSHYGSESLLSFEKKNVCATRIELRTSCRALNGKYILPSRALRTEASGEACE